MGSEQRTVLQMILEQTKALFSTGRARWSLRTHLNLAKDQQKPW